MRAVGPKRRIFAHAARRALGVAMLVGGAGRPHA